MEKKEFFTTVKEISRKNTDFREGFDRLFQFIAENPDSLTASLFFDYWVESGEPLTAEGKPCLTYLIGRNFHFHEWVSGEDLTAFLNFTKKESKREDFT